jgi:hypothetical protein
MNSEWDFERSNDVSGQMNYCIRLRHYEAPLFAMNEPPKEEENEVGMLSYSIKGWSPFPICSTGRLYITRCNISEKNVQVVKPLLINGWY